MSGQTPIKTNFFENQARENARPGTARGVRIALGALLVIGIAFGAFQVFQFFSNFQTNQYARNISIVLKSPRLDAGKATVDVTITNLNPFAIEHPVFGYDIDDASGKEIARGQVSLDGTVPPLDRRTFRGVLLGKVEGTPARMHTDLKGITAGKKSALPSSFLAGLVEANELATDERMPVIDRLVGEAPDFAPIYIARGLLLEDRRSYDRAKADYEKAAAVEPSCGNAHYHLALMLLRDGKEDKARAELLEAQRLSPEDGAAKDLMARLESGAAAESDETAAP